MIKRTSHIERIRRQHAQLKIQVQNLLGWNDSQYAAFQEEQGLHYLRRQFGGAALINEVPKHKEFWSWWRLHWVRRDSEFLDMSGMLFPHEYEQYYRDLHRPGSVQFRPHAAILENTYKKMIHNLVKQAVKQ